MLLKTWQSSKNHTLAKLLQGVRQQVTWRTLLGGGNLDHVYLKGDMGIEVKNHQPFYSDHCANLAKIPYYIRDKKIRTRSLAEAKLEQFCHCFICHPQV